MRSTPLSLLVGPHLGTSIADLRHSSNNLSIHAAHDSTFSIYEITTLILLDYAQHVSLRELK